jgi:amino acid permease
MLLASEVTASGLVIEYWQSPVNVGVWIAIILVGEYIQSQLSSIYDIL